MSGPELVTLRFEGEVGVTSSNPCTVMIGDRNVLDEVTDITHYRKKHMIIQLLHGDDGLEIVSGTAVADEGMKGYSELTPGDPSLFYVGEADLLKRLVGLEGSEISLEIAIST